MASSDESSDSAKRRHNDAARKRGLEGPAPQRRRRAVRFPDDPQQSATGPQLQMVNGQRVDDLEDVSEDEQTAAAGSQTAEQQNRLAANLEEDTVLQLLKTREDTASFDRKMNMPNDHESGTKRRQVGDDLTERIRLQADKACRVKLKVLEAAKANQPMKPLLRELEQLHPTAGTLQASGVGYLLCDETIWPADLTIEVNRLKKMWKQFIGAKPDAINGYEGVHFAYDIDAPR